MALDLLEMLRNVELEIGRLQQLRESLKRTIEGSMQPGMDSRKIVVGSSDVPLTRRGRPRPLRGPGSGMLSEAGRIAISAAASHRHLAERLRRAMSDKTLDKATINSLKKQVEEAKEFAEVARRKSEEAKRARLLQGRQTGAQ